MFKVFVKKQIEKEIQKIKSKSLFGSISKKNVFKIIEKVKKFGDKALIELTKKYDNVSLSHSSIKVSKNEIKSAYTKVDKSFLSALEELGANITKFHKNQKEKEWFDTLNDNAIYGMRNIPIESVGVYVPGGSACYPSSVMMNVIPAKLAGVLRIVMVSPPPISPYVLVAASELKVDEIYRIGGAQAIAALAYGTKTIKPVNKIVGPGNVYVTLAKKLVSYKVGIDSMAGPSDILIIADSDANPKYVAADLLSQCEHDADAQAILVTDSRRLADMVLHEVKVQFKTLKRRNVIKQSIEANGKIFLVSSIKEAVEIANKIAPEHLEILTDSPQKVLEGIFNAGAVFLGPYSFVALGDYGAGPNHVLPTFGTSAFSSTLSVCDFIKKQSVLAYTKEALVKIQKHIKTLADIEGFDAHKKSLEIRLDS